MNRRRLLAAGFLVAFACLDGCLHRAARIGPYVSPPQGLDSLGTAKWIDAQRAACPGHLQFMSDYGGAARDFDGVARYHSPLVEVRCIRP